MSKVLILLGLALLVAACATTPTPSQTTAATATGSQPQLVVARGTQDSGDKLICTDTYPLGSHIPQRICLTKAQEEARQKAAQEALRNLQAAKPCATGATGTGC